jgi:hypothetical protein
MISGIFYDEAFHYDCLSILLVKTAKGSDAAKAGSARMSGELAMALGMRKHGGVMGSTEFDSLVRLNEAIFETVDRIKTGEPRSEDARLVDSLNYQRYLAKRDLQERFFPETPLVERKIGYGEIANQS